MIADAPSVVGTLEPAADVAVAVVAGEATVAAGSSLDVVADPGTLEPAVAADVTGDSDRSGIASPSPAHAPTTATAAKAAEAATAATGHRVTERRLDRRVTVPSLRTRPDLVMTTPHHLELGPRSAPNVRRYPPARRLTPPGRACDLSTSDSLIHSGNPRSEDNTPPESPPATRVPARHPSPQCTPEGFGRTRVHRN
ncbi:MAG: hypothetical protein FD127_1514, partial [Acidimicrobiaceae bacterium]